MIPVFMVFENKKGIVTYVYSYLSFDEASRVVADLNLKKGEDTSYYVISGWRYE